MPAPKKTNKRPDAIVDREIAKATLEELAKGERVPVFINSLSGRKGELRCFRINGVPNYVKVGMLDFVKPLLYEHICDQARRGKISVASLNGYNPENDSDGYGKFMGEVK